MTKTGDRGSRAAARAVVLLLAAAVAGLAGVVSLDAQDGATSPPSAAPLRIGVFFWHDSPNDELALDGIRAALTESRRPHEVVVERADEDRARGRAILERFTAADGDPVDLVFAMGTQAALLARDHETTVPVVFTAVTSPVESGVVPAWSGSGRANLCGNSNWIAPETVLEVFRLAVPELELLGMIRSRDAGVVSGAELRGLRDHLATVPASGSALEIIEAVVDDAESLGAAVDELAAAGAQAIWIPIDIGVYQHMDRVLAAARRHRLPLVSSSLKGTGTGAVAGIYVDYEMLGQRAVVLALRVLAGEVEPARAPIGTMRDYRVVVNLAAARECGFDVPLSLLVVADRIDRELAGTSPGANAGGGK